MRALIVLLRARADCLGAPARINPIKAAARIPLLNPPRLTCDPSGQRPRRMPIASRQPTTVGPVAHRYELRAGRVRRELNASIVGRIEATAEYHRDTRQ